MKRIAPSVLVALLLTIVLAAFHEFTDIYAVKEVGKYWILFGLTWSIGILATVLAYAIVGRILHLEPGKWTGQDLRAAIFTTLASSLFLGAWCHHLVGRTLSFLFFDNPLTIVRMHVSDTYGMLLSWSILGGLVYLLYRVGERTRYRREKIEAVRRDKKQKIVLIAKLTVVGVVVMIISLLVADIEMVQRMQLSFLDRKWNTEKDSFIRGLTFENSGVSHRTYLEAMLQTCAKLHEAGAKVVVVPLPNNLVYSESRAKLIRQISGFGNVIFAVTPEAKGVESEFLVDHPMENKVPIRWGVISAEPFPTWWWSAYKYYPVAYRDADTRLHVPDVAMIVVQQFFNDRIGPEPLVTGRTLVMGNYQTGLFNDKSALILHRMNLFQTFDFYASAGENSDTVQFAVGGSELKPTMKPSENVWHLLDGKIVLIEPGKEITGTYNFAWTYANIIHNILNGESTTPLDAWTALITILMLVIVACSIYLLKPWLGLAFVAGLTLGQGYFFSWLATSHGIGVEFVAPIFGTILGLFAFSFVFIADERKHMDRYEKNRILQELRTAHDMQMGLMPTEDPTIPGYEISGFCKPADEVGGDFFDYVWLDDRKTRLGIAIGDVSGKAMKAAITAVMTSGMVYREVGTNETPRSILRKINRPMYLKTEKRIFTAMSFAVIDLRKKKMTLSNAGQMQPLLKRGDKIQSVKVDGNHLPLGMTEDVEYGEAKLQLRKGDVIVFHTDGVPEAMNGKDELFGFERLERIVTESGADLSAKQVVANIVDCVADFTGSTKQHDDMTVVVVRVL